MALFQRGDLAALGRLVERYNRPLYNFARRYLGEATSAEEIVQETFARIVRKPGDWRPTGRFRAWIYSIARNLCIDARRKEMVRRRVSSLSEQPRHSGADDTSTLEEVVADSRAGTEQAAVARQLRERVIWAISKLPDDQREVYVLREISNLPFREIATLVGAPENTVKSRMRYALEHLQHDLCDFEEYARALR